MFTRETNPGLGRSGRVLPRLECLEERCCPSSVSFSVSHVLTLQGDTSNSTMIVQDDGHGDVKVTLNGHVTSVRGVQEIVLNSKGGSDTIDYTLTNTLTTSEQFKLNLGTGNDRVNLNFSKGVTAPSLNIDLNGGGGGDRTMSVEFGAITNTDLTLAAQLGSDWDHFSTSFNGAVSGHAKVSANVLGGAGYDDVNFNVNGNIGAQAQVNVQARLGVQENTAHVNYSGQLDGKLSVNLQGGSSWNWLESHFNLAPGSTGSLVAHELGGPSADLLILMVNDAGSHLKSLNALINGEGGLNSAGSTPNVKVYNAH